MFKSRTYLAIGLLVVVGGLAIWQVTKKSPYEHREDAKASPLPSMKKEDIDEIEIVEGAKPPVVLKKEGEWKVVAPLVDRADQKAAEQAVETLATLKLGDVIAEKAESMEKVGMKEGETTKVTPKKGGKALVTIQLGKTSNVRIGDAPQVWSTTNLKRFALVRETKMWRDRTIFAFQQDQIDTLEVDYGGTKVAVKREAPPPAAAAPDGGPPPPPAPSKWAVTAGQQEAMGGPLDDNVMVNLASSLGRLEASDFPTETTPEKTGLDKPRATLTVTLTDKTQKQLLIGKDEGQDTYAKLATGDRVWKIHIYEADRIPVSPANWRDKVVVRIPRADVKKVELTRGTDRLVFERVDDKSFKATTPANFGPVDDTRVMAILSTLEQLRATRVVDQPDQKTFAAPTVIVTVTKKDGKTFKLTVGPKDGKLAEYPAQVAGAKDVYALPEYVVGNYLKGPGDFKKKSGS
jgi:hypothetical protein